MSITKIVALVPTYVEHSGWQAPLNTALQESSADAHAVEQTGLSPRGSRAEFAYLLQATSGGSQPLTSSIEGQEMPTTVAKRLLHEVLSACELDSSSLTSIPRSVGVIEDEASSTLVLVYTIAIPQLLALSRENFIAKGFFQGTIGHLLQDPYPLGSTQVDEVVSPDLGAKVQWATLRYWADLISSTNAALELLPKYFTIIQLIDVCTAILRPDKDIDPANFRRWAESNRSEDKQSLLVLRADDAKVREELFKTIKSKIDENTVADSPYERFALKAIEAMLTRQGTPWTSPVNKVTEPRDDGRALPPDVADIIVKAATSIAFQPAKTAGATAGYYTAASTSLVHLKDRFGKQPTWMKWIQPG